MAYTGLVDRTDAGPLIPEEASREIIKSLPRASVSLTSFRSVRMARGQQRQPVLSVLPTAYWVGETDTGRKQTTEVNWDNQYLDARELAVIIPVPEAVVDDVDYDIWGEITPPLVEAFGAAIDAATLFGVSAPTGWPNSIVEQAVAAGNSYLEGTSGVDFGEDINQTMALVEADGFDVTAFWARRKVRARLRGLRDDNGQPIYQPIAQGSPPSLYGETLSFVSNGSWVNNYELIAGDPRAAILGVRQDITYKILTEGVISDDSGVVVLNLAQQDAVALRAVMRVAFQIANPINRENENNATRFPFSVLINAGS